MNKILKMLDFVVMAAAAVIPFFMSIAPAPLNVFIGFLIVAFILKKILKRQRVSIPGTTFKALSLFFLITCLSIIHSCNYADTLRGGIFRLIMYILVFLAVQEIRSKKALNWIVISVSLGVTLTCIDSCWQVTKGKDFIRGYEPVLNLGLARATASFQDSNVLGVYLASLSPLLLGLALYFYRGRAKLVLSLAGIFGLIGILLTYSRPTYLAIFIALLFMAIVKKDKIIIGALVILTLISPFIIPKSVRDWAREMQYNPLRMMCNDDRIAVYRNTLNMIKAHPVIGVGANTFMKNYRFYKESPEYRNVKTIDYIYAHNNFLHMAGEVGLVGLFIFFWFIFSIFKQGGAIIRRQENSYFIICSLSLLACVAAFLVNGLTESSLYYSRVAPLFWYLAGLLFAMRNFAPDDAK